MPTKKISSTPKQKKNDNTVLIVVLVVIGVLILLSLGSCLACNMCGAVMSIPY